MDPMDSEHVEVFEQSLQGWTDSRFLSREQLRTIAMFTMYLVNIAEHDGWDLYGYSWKQSPYLGCLVVKANIEGVAQVVFTSAATPVEGMGIFLRKVEHGLLEWRPDRFRT